jgi:hypothetical protein
MEDQGKKLIEEKLKIEKQFQSGADWFFWIAGLSLINSVLLLAGSKWGFIIGLGITRIIDEIGLVIAEKIGIAGKIIALIFDIIAAGVFVLFGVFARKRYKWAFITGMVLYALDGMIFLLVQDFLSVGFHVFALFCIFGGFKSLGKLSRLEEPQTVATQSMVASNQEITS